MFILFLRLCSKDTELNNQIKRYKVNIESITTAKEMLYNSLLNKYRQSC